MEVSVLFATVGNGILLQPRVYSIVQRLLWDFRLGTSVLTNLSSCQLPKNWWLVQVVLGVPWLASKFQGKKF